MVEGIDFTMWMSGSVVAPPAAHSARTMRCTAAMICRCSSREVDRTVSPSSAVVGMTLLAVAGLEAADRDDGRRAGRDLAGDDGLQPH